MASAARRPEGFVRSNRREGAQTRDAPSGLEVGFWKFRWIVPENVVVFVVTTANKVGLLLSSFQHQVCRVLRGLVLRHNKSKSAQVKTGKQCFSLTKYDR